MAARADKAGEGISRDIDITKMPRVSRLPWAGLLKRVFMTDALTCQGQTPYAGSWTTSESRAKRRAAARPPPQADLSCTLRRDSVRKL